MAKPYNLPQKVATVLAHLCCFNRRLPQGAPTSPWNRMRDEVLEALDHPGTLQTEARNPWGHRTVNEFLGFAFYDPLVHAWDLAKAVGHPPVLDAQLAQRALDHLTAFGKHKELRQPISLAAPVVTTAQDPVSRLIAFTGLILLATIGAAWSYGTRLIAMGTAYTAKMVCSEVFAAGREPDAVLADLVVDDLAALRFIDVSIDTVAKTATASFYGLATSTVRYRDAVGCALATDAVTPTSWAISARQGPVRAHGLRIKDTPLSSR